MKHLIFRSGDGGTLTAWMKDTSTGNKMGNYDVWGVSPREGWSQLTNGQGGVLDVTQISRPHFELPSGYKLMYYPSSSSGGVPTIALQPPKGGSKIQAFRFIGGY